MKNNIFEKPRKTHKSPTHLSPASQRWFKSVVENWDLDDHHVKLLIATCEVLDRAEEARLQLQTDGAYFRDRHGEIKKHPALVVERDNKILFARLLRELDLDLEAPPEASRPPQLQSFRGGKS